MYTAVLIGRDPETPPSLRIWTRIWGALYVGKVTHFFVTALLSYVLKN
jgi:hypothetical protein